MVYSYLIICAGQEDMCWPNNHKIVVNCNCSENTARKAVTSLVRKRFIRKVTTYEDWGGRSRQTNNTYYILDLPPIQSSAVSAPAKRYRQVENAAASQPPP